MTMRISKRNHQIINTFKTYFNISAFYSFCSQIFCKENSSLTKKYQSLCRQLQLYKARVIKSQKQQRFLETKIKILVSCLKEGFSILQKIQVNQLINIFKLLDEWKKTITICFSFLKELAEKDWKQLKSPIVNHINKYYQIVASVLSDILFRKDLNIIPKQNCLLIRGMESSEFQKSPDMQVLGQKFNQKATKWQHFKDILKMGESFTYKSNSITLYRKEKKSPVEVSNPKKWKKKEIKRQYDSNCKNRFFSQEIENLNFQDQKLTKFTNFFKQTEENEILNQIDLERKLQSKVEISMHQTQICKRPETKLILRHRSTIQNKLNTKSIYPKSSFKSSSKIEQLNKFTTNTYQTLSQLTCSTNSKIATKSNKIQGKDSVARNRVSKIAFRKSLVEKLQNQKMSQNQLNTNFISNQELQKINESKQNLSQSDQSSQQLKEIKQQNTENDFNYIQKKDQKKEEVSDNFCSLKSFKKQKHNRRLGLTNNNTSPLHSLDSIQNFLSADSKKEIKKVKNQSSPSFFRTSGMNFVENKRSINGFQTKMFQYKKKSVAKNQKNEDILNETGFQQKNTEKIFRRFHTEVYQNVSKINMIDTKEYYQMLTQININQQKSFQEHPEYYDQIFRRKYSNNQKNFDYSQTNKAKPFKFKLETHIINKQKINKDILLFDFMGQTIKNSQSLSLGQYGIPQIF